MHIDSMLGRRRSALAVKVGLAALGLAGAVLLAETLAVLVGARTPSRVAAVYRASQVPGVQYTLIPSLDTWALGMDLRTNALGFRGPEWSHVKAREALRIALIGDSHAFGFGVSFEATVGEVLARLLRERLARPVEVLDFAVNGYNARQQLAVLDHFALGFSPDVVILVPCNNDDDPAAFAAASGYLVARAEDVDRAVDSPVEPWRSKLVEVIHRVTERLRTSAHAATATTTTTAGDEGDPEQTALDAAVGAPLREMIRDSQGAGARVVLAPFAGPPVWRRLFQGTARDAGIPLVELLELFPEAHGWDDLVEKFGVGWDPHLGPEAHRRWAVALADVIAADLERR